jgi:dTDP-4-dehydrorhamnose reductase
MPGPLLVTGGSGYLGGELLRQAGGRRPLAATYLSGRPDGPEGVDWSELDVRDAAAVHALLERVRPEVVIHTAYRQDGEGARETTVEGAAAVAGAARAVGARLIHLSSDVIFDGSKATPYDESDPPTPVTEYGQAKADAEGAVVAAHPEALVVRTSLIYGGPTPSRHERLALEAARGEGQAFFDDEVRCPVVVVDLASALLELSERGESGVLNVAGADEVSRYEFACLIAGAAGLSPERIRCTSIADSGLARPGNCTLTSERAAGLLRTRLRGARERLAANA